LAFSVRADFRQETLLRDKKLYLALRQRRLSGRCGVLAASSSAGANMARTSSSVTAMIAVMLAVASGVAVAAQDRYTLKLGKLSFGDFRGYENWQDVSVSQTEKLLKVILANDVMMKAYRRGLPADGKLFPEGSKIVKIEWSFKKNPVAPYFVQVPDTLVAVATIEKDSKRFPDTHGWAYGNFSYDAASDTFKGDGTDAKCGYACHTAVASKDYIFTAYPKR
jgi:Cytochrome P460